MSADTGDTQRARLLRAKHSFETEVGELIAEFEEENGVRITYAFLHKANEEFPATEIEFTTEDVL